MILVVRCIAFTFHGGSYPFDFPALYALLSIAFLPFLVAYGVLGAYFFKSTSQPWHVGIYSALF